MKLSDIRYSFTIEPTSNSPVPNAARSTDYSCREFLLNALEGRLLNFVGGAYHQLCVKKVSVHVYNVKLPKDRNFLLTTLLSTGDKLYTSPENRVAQIEETSDRSFSVHFTSPTKYDSPTTSLILFLLTRYELLNLKDFKRSTRISYKGDFGVNKYLKDISKRIVDYASVSNNPPLFNASNFYYSIMTAFGLYLLSTNNGYLGYISSSVSQLSNRIYVGTGLQPQVGEGFVQKTRRELLSSGRYRIFYDFYAEVLRDILISDRNQSDVEHYLGLPLIECAKIQYSKRLRTDF